VIAHRTLTLHPAFAAAATEIHLDSLVNPFAPVPGALDLGRGQLLSHDRQTVEDRIRARVAHLHQANPDNIVFGGDSADVLAMLAELTRGQSAFVESPDLVTGAMLLVRDAVRQARAHRWLIIDERGAGFALRDHQPLFREFDNVILVRSLDPWLVPVGSSFQYLLAKNAELREAMCHIKKLPIESAMVAESALSDPAYRLAANRQVIRERVYLQRSLRKLNMIRPLPSASSFVAAVVERGDRDALRAFLDSRSIWLHYPEDGGFERLVRISAVSHRATFALCAALIDWAKTL